MLPLATARSYPLGNTTKTIKCGNSSAPTATAADCTHTPHSIHPPHTLPHLVCVCGGGHKSRAKVVVSFAFCLCLCLGWPKTASTLYAPFSVRLPMLNAGRHNHSNPQHPHSDPNTPACLLSLSCPAWVWEASLRRAPCSVLRCSSLWTRKRNVSHKMLSQRFTTRLLRITRPPPPLPNPRLGQLWQASSRSVAVSASASACVASSNLFYDNIRAFSAEI